MGNCCFGAAGDEKASPGHGNGAQGGEARKTSGVPEGEGGKPPLPKSKRGLNKEQEAALNALYEGGVIGSEEDVYKTDFSDGSVPPLHSQSRKGNFKEVGQLLLLDKDKTNIRVVYGSRTALHQAATAKQGRFQTCKLLIDADEWQLSQKTTDGRNVLHMASESDDDSTAVVELLLSKAGKEMLADKRNDGSNCLHLACSAGRIDMVRAIIKADPLLVNVVDGEVRTCLHLACSAGHTDVVKDLLDVEGIQMANKDRKGFTCLALSAMNGNKDIVKILLAKDKPLASIRDRSGKSPFDLCAEFGKKPEHWAAAQEILAADPSLIMGKPPIAPEAPAGGEEAKPKPKLGGLLAKVGGAAKADAAASGATQSALHYAAAHGSKEGIQLCMSADAQLIKSKNASGSTPLHIAAQAGHIEILNDLIALNGGVGDLNGEGQNLLHLAAANGHLEIVAMLLKSHPELAIGKDKHAHTPLEAASLAPKANAKVVKLLLDVHPEQLSVPDAEGKTLLHHVAHSGNEDLVWLFGEKGGTQLIKTKDNHGSDCIEAAAPNCVTILEDLVERENDETHNTKPVESRVV